MGRAEAAFSMVTEAVLNLEVWRERALLLVRDLINDAAVARLVVGSAEEAARSLIGWVDSTPQGSHS